MASLAKPEATMTPLTLRLKYSNLNHHSLTELTFPSSRISHILQWAGEYSLWFSALGMGGLDIWGRENLLYPC